jgi:hypothetical protein
MLPVPPFIINSGECALIAPSLESALSKVFSR